MLKVILLPGWLVLGTHKLRWGRIVGNPMNAESFAGTYNEIEWEGGGVSVGFEPDILYNIPQS